MISNFVSLSSSPSGSDDLSAKLWDVSTGQCIYGIQTHTCATVKFDEQKLVTGSFDNTMACWDWSSGAKIQQFRGHTGAGETPTHRFSSIVLRQGLHHHSGSPSPLKYSVRVSLFLPPTVSFFLPPSFPLSLSIFSPVFSLDYDDDLDLLVSGSADFSVKVWSLTAGSCLNTLTGHTEWVTKVSRISCCWFWTTCNCSISDFDLLLFLIYQVILQKSQVESLLHRPGDHILLSADKYEIKVREPSGTTST